MAAPLDSAALVRAVCKTGGSAHVIAVLLCGSMARGEADGASDVDVIALVRGHSAFVRVGRFAGRDAEVIYLPEERARLAPVQRGTLAGARVLYDPSNVAGPWLAAVHSRVRQDPPLDAADALYGRWALSCGTWPAHGWATRLSTLSGSAADGRRPDGGSWRRCATSTPKPTRSSLRASRPRRPRACFRPAGPPARGSLSRPT